MLSLSPALWLSDTGSDLSVWPDISGNGRNVTQVITASQPAIIAGAQNGRQVRRFDGGDVMYGSMGVSLTDCTLVSVQKILTNSTAWRGTITTGALNTASEAGGRSHSIIQLGTGQNRMGASGLSPQTDGYASGDVGTSFRIFSATFSGTTLTSWLDGDVIVGPKTIASITEAGSQIRVGRARTAGELWVGDIAEVIVLPYAATTAQRQSVESYLNNKWTIY